jgi:hypothetical protein
MVPVRDTAVVVMGLCCGLLSPPVTGNPFAGRLQSRLAMNQGNRIRMAGLAMNLLLGESATAKRPA